MISNIRIIQIIIFLSAFLLFQIELIIGKILLPHYGGSYMVWGACVVFFQAALLFGYMFAHYGIQRLGIYKYRYLHLTLIFLPLLFFPGKSLPMQYDVGDIPMVLDVFIQLLSTIGLVFFVLSTMSIVWQSWLSKSDLPESKNPYALFAVSNFGSFLALFSYPAFFEMFYDLGIQQNMWRVTYLFLLLMQIVAFHKIHVVKDHGEKAEHVDVSKYDMIQWCLYGAAGVIVFLGVTNLITLEIAAVPLLWVIPLAIYLLTFVLNFKKNPWRPAWIENKIYITLGYSIVLFFIMQQKTLPVLVQLILLVFFLFHICMFCQLKLHKQKPKDPSKLTFFYFMISLGSFVGGIIVTWVIPLISTLLIEYLIGLFVIAIALAIKDLNKPMKAYNIRLLIYVIITLIVWPIVFTEYSFLGCALLIFIFRSIYSEFRKNPRALAVSILIVICMANAIEFLWVCPQNYYVTRHRNYYGVCKVFDREGARYLIHGTTIHGAQFLSEEHKLTPLLYYSKISPVGEILDDKLFPLKRIGIQGLGIGTMSAYFKEGQDIDYFELDPDVYPIAEKNFAFIKNSKGNVRYIYGDARLSLEKIPDNYYDFLISDAFGGDCLPVHLVTVEALQKYRNHIKENGLVLFHISNRYIDHAYALSKTAYDTGAYVAFKKGENFSNYYTKSVWIAVTWNRNTANKLISKLDWHPIKKDKLTKIRKWTDKYSNILPYIKVEELILPIKKFKIFSW